MSFCFTKPIFPDVRNEKVYTSKGFDSERISLEQAIAECERRKEANKELKNYGITYSDIKAINWISQKLEEKEME